ncbi:MAG TPA: PIN domain-containing protein [Polyangiaceae bacterium]|nr:PIN domain-containing protein [Polyangiaceae bacterium]
MPAEPALLDTDTLSEVSRANPIVTARARAYLLEFGRLTISSVTVFERLRGYRQALRAGKPFHAQLKAFETLVRNCVILPFDEDAADVASTIWSACSRSQRQSLGDILIASIAIARQVPLVTRNKRDFEGFTKAANLQLRLVDWTSSSRQRSRTT